MQILDRLNSSMIQERILILAGECTQSYEFDDIY